MEIESLIRERVKAYIETKYNGVNAAAAATGIPQSTLSSVFGKPKNVPGMILMYKLKKADPTLDINQFLIEDFEASQNQMMANEPSMGYASNNDNLVKVLINNQASLLESTNNLIKALNDVVIKNK